MSRRDLRPEPIPSPPDSLPLDEPQDGEVYTGRSLLTEMLKIERTERRDPPPGAPVAISSSTPTGAEVLAADYEEQVGLAVECAFEKYVEEGNRVTELYGGFFCIARAPKLYV